MKTKLFNIIALVLAMLLNTINAESVNLDASITIKTNLILQEEQPLNFGIVIKPNQEIMVKLTEDNLLKDASGGLIPNANATAGRYKLIGKPNANININVDTVGTLASDTGALNATYSISNPPNMLSATGEADVVIIGSVSIPNNITTGVYSGTFKLTYSY